MCSMPRLMNVVGARPQFVKAGPVSRALADAGAEEVLVDTGQHYDELMTDVIMRDVGLRKPDFNLGVGSATHGIQTARMLEGLEELIDREHPDAVLTYGDTNSTLAAALASSKLGVFTAHVEAGMRSFNRAMPEELNRTATDHISDLLLAPTRTAVENLEKEGLASRTVLTGDVMVDALVSIEFAAIDLPSWASGEFYTATIHRPSNTDDPARVHAVIDSFSGLDHPVHLMAHPRLKSRLVEFGLAVGDSGLRLHDPLPYGEMLAVVKASRGLLTDSGGLQKEAFILQVPCATIREETEWPETLQGGWNVLVGSDLARLSELVARTPRGVKTAPFGDGRAAERVVEEVLRHVS